ncbi:MAG: hypothetical protein ABFS21_10350 [Actinomycetota bacterium]
MSSRPENEARCDRASRYWWVWTVLALGAGAVTTITAKGFPIIELELAGSAERAVEVIGDTSLDVVQTTILWDFLFIALYTMALFCAVVWARRGFRSRGVRRFGIMFAFGALLAGLLDVTENVAMLTYLNEWYPWEWWMQLAAIAAIGKFALVAAAIGYFLAGTILIVARKLRPRRSKSKPDREGEAELADTGTADSALEERFRMVTDVEPEPAETETEDG